MDIKYFDNAATTRIKEEVLEEMFPYLSVEYGNPSSVYSIGRKARKAIQEARNKVASLINCKPYEIYFTSCGSESDNMALKGLSYAQMYKKSGKNHIITSKIEHPAIMNTCKTLEKQGFEITYVDVDENGFINLNTLENAITDKTFLISIMYANNEIGTIEPIDEISKIAHKHNILFHTDSVQAVGNIKIDVQKSNIDMLSLSGHKIYAPKGIGALYVKKEIEFERFLDGGHQERGPPLLLRKPGGLRCAGRPAAFRREDRRPGGTAPGRVACPGPGAGPLPANDPVTEKALAHSCGEGFPIFGKESPMNKTITLEFPAKKLEALSHFLKKKDTTINTELDYALARLYEKTVPPTVREFLEDTGEDGDASQTI